MNVTHTCLLYIPIHLKERHQQHFETKRVQTCYCSPALRLSFGSWWRHHEPRTDMLKTISAFCRNQHVQSALCTAPEANQQVELLRVSRECSWCVSSTCWQCACVLAGAFVNGILQGLISLGLLQRRRLCEFNPRGPRQRVIAQCISASCWSVIELQNSHVWPELDKV